MNIKKLSSIVLTIAMLISMFSISALADPADAFYELSFEKIGGSGSIEIDDMFFAVITLKGATTLAAGQVSLDFDPGVVNLVNPGGIAVSDNFDAVTDKNTRLHVRVTYFDPIAYEDKSVFETVEAGNMASNATGNIIYNFSTNMMSGGEYLHYDLEQDEIDNGLLVLKIRFKALAAGNANFAYTEDEKTMYNDVMGGDFSFPTTGATALTIAEGEVPVVKTALENKITEAQNLFDNTDVGEEIGEVKAEDKADLGTAIGIAQGVLDDDAATQDEIDEAVSNLEVAITAFENAVITGAAIKIASATVTENETFTVDVSVKDLRADVKAIAFGIEYDEDVLQFISAVGAAGIFDHEEVDEKTDKTFGFSGTVADGASIGADVYTVIATVSFKALAVGSSDLEFIDTAFGYEAGGAVQPFTTLEKGEITVEVMTDVPLGEAIQALADYEAAIDAVVALSDIAGARAKGVIAAEKIADLTAAHEKYVELLEAKGILDGVLDALEAKLQAINTADTAVTAYQTAVADIDEATSTLEDVATAKGLGTTAQGLVNALEDGTVKDGFNARISGASGTLKTKADAIALALVNDGDAEDIAYETLLPDDAETDKVDSYNNAAKMYKKFIRNNENLTAADVADLVDKVNDFAAADKGKLSEGGTVLNLMSAVWVRDLFDNQTMAGLTITQLLRADMDDSGTIGVGDIVAILKIIAQKMQEK